MMLLVKKKKLLVVLAKDKEYKSKEYLGRYLK